MNKHSRRGPRLAPFPNMHEGGIKRYTQKRYKPTLGLLGYVRPSRNPCKAPVLNRNGLQGNAASVNGGIRT